MNKQKNKRQMTVKLFIVSIVLAIALVSTGLINYRQIAFAASDYDYYTKDFQSGSEYLEKARELNEEICEEGFVLLKNDGLLPMAPKPGQSKIKTSMFGNHSASLIYCGFGSSDTWQGTTSVYSAFTNSIFDLNPTLKAFYNDSSKSGTKISGHDSIDNYRVGLPINETPKSAYTADIKNSFTSYNELAVVFITRTAGEGSDLPLVSLKSGFTARDNSNKLDGARNWDDHYLQLDRNEVDMLQMVMDNFDDIVVIMNGSSYVELGFLDDPTHYLYTDNGYTSSVETAAGKMSKFKAAININMPGTDGILALPRIMDGTVNPSGHLVDTWVKDLKKDPVSQNIGLSGMTDAELRYGEYYVHYDEDIYMGYRYYETRYLTEGDNGDDWYFDSVVYPFGHGLSFTDFEFTLIDEPDTLTLEKHGVITTKVRVTNAGDRAGKDVVQLYYSAPYTANGIAKAHVVLGGFKKTGLIQPGEHEDVTIKLNVSDMYSYDWSDANGNGFKGYELDAGDYKIIAAHDAHDAARLPEERTVTYKIQEGFRYETDTTTGTEVKNRFDYASGPSKTNDPDKFKGVRQYMSRDDFEGTFPTHASEKQVGLKQGKQQFSMSESADKTQPWYVEDMPVQASTPGTSATNKIKLWHLKDRDYNDPLWDEFLNQFTIGEMAVLVGDGFRGTAAMASIDKPTVWTTDGPLGRRESTDIQWASNVIVSQTFNTELAYEEGVMFGNTVFSGPSGRGGTFGVGLDIHRSPFGGRYFEYYSEDGWLSGIMGAEVVAGSNSKGCYQVIKHLMLNDQETQRNTVQTWVSEQALREIYGKGFELATKLGGALSMMTGVNSIGDIPCSLNHALLEQLIRGEWGFEGYIITDMYCEDTNISMRAGIDTMMAHPSPKPPSTAKADLTATHVAALRRATKNICFTFANSTGINGQGGDRLDGINYIGTNALYAVENVENTLRVDTASVKYDPDASIAYSLRAGSELPDGMELEPDGTITGAPTESGTFSFAIIASENTTAYYPYNDASKTFRLTVYQQNRIPDQIIYEDIDLGVLPYGYEYSKSIQSAVVFDSSGKLNTNIKYTVATGSELPKGLLLDNGIISGKVAASPGTYFFTIVASCDGKQSAELDFIVKVKAYSIVYNAQQIDDMTVGKKVDISVATAYSNDGVQIKYLLKDGSKLPEGLTMSSLGQITGVPTRAYNGHKFTVLAYGDLSPTQEATYTVDVYGVVFEDVMHSGLIIGNDYNFKLNASPNNGTTAQIYYEVKDGSKLPGSFKLLADGTLFGSCNTWGAVSFTVLAISEGNLTAEATITLDFYMIIENTLEDEPPLPDINEGCSTTIDLSTGLISMSLIITAGVAVMCIKGKSKNQEDK